MRALTLLLVIAGCGGDDAAWVALANAPAATRALAVDTDDAIVAIGGPSAFGLATLQRADGDTWTDAAGVPMFDAHATLVGGRGAAAPSTSGVPLYALSETQLFAREGGAWTASNLPVGATANTAFGVDAMGLVYALALEADGNGAVLAWQPGAAQWTEVPGTRPIGVGAAQFVVADDGILTWVVPARGVVRLVGTSQVVLASCTDAALGGCADAIQGLGVQGDRVSFVMCPGAALFSDGGTLATKPLPADVTCGAVASDGVTAVAATYPSAGGTGDVLQIDFDDDDWKRIAPSVPGVRYGRIGTQTFGYAPAPTGEDQRGIHVLR